MSKELKILQANLHKSLDAQLSLFNDEALKDFSLLLLSEPHCFRVEGKPVVSPVSHPYWTPYRPATEHNGSCAFRSMIWAHRDLQPRQVPIRSPDLTAISLQLQDRILLVISVYIPPRDRSEHGRDSAEDVCSRTDLVRLAITDLERQHVHRKVEVVVAGDFNRHDQLWGGDGVGASPQQGEAAEILSLIQDFDLQSLLPRGTITYESTRSESTIDLILTSATLADSRIRCGLYDLEHGSDHRAIETTFAIDTPKQSAIPSLLFKHAPWDRIRDLQSACVHRP